MTAEKLERDVAVNVHRMRGEGYDGSDADAVRPFHQCSNLGSTQPEEGGHCTVGPRVIGHGSVEECLCGC